MTWINEPEFEGSDGREIVSGHTLIATVYNTTDAHLIAAAPDLLAACEAMAAQLGGGDNFDQWEEAKAQLLAAIAKAKGA
jgi:hypothetical protein